MSVSVVVLVATMSGTAEMVADALADAIEDAGHEPEIRRMEKFSPSDFDKDKLYIVCSSTYGDGEVPDNGKTFFAALETDKPDLAGLKYGVIALGDSIYPNTFCFGGKKFDELLSSLGAERLGERLQHDSRSSEYAEDVAEAWAGDWLDEAIKALGS